MSDLPEWSFQIERLGNRRLFHSDVWWNGQHQWKLVICRNGAHWIDDKYLTHRSAMKHARSFMRTKKAVPLRKKSRRQIRKEKKLELKLGMPQ